MIDGTDLSTMKQTNENVTSINRIVSRLVNDDASKVDDVIKFGVSFLGEMVTHEEGHRSVLTNLEIGAISQPFSIFKGVAYVKGVTDETLINLRDNDLPDYIRLHTAGLESDYSNMIRDEGLIALGLDDYENIGTEYIVHKMAHLSYFLTTLIPGLSPKLKEETNELERDIVGHDIFGAVRHLHRPDMAFYRYTNYDDLTKEEKRFAKKVSLFSLFNLANPILFGKTNFKINDKLKANAGLGYTLAPFGGFIDENFWIDFDNRIKVHSYIREFHNKSNWFLGGGVKLVNYALYQDKIMLNADLNLWSQPKNLSFTESNGDFGFGGELNIGYKVYDTKNQKHSIYLNSGISYKEDGFIPEYASLNESTKINFGFSFTW